MSALDGVVSALAWASYLRSTARATQSALGPPTLEEALAAENAALREGLAQWQEYAGRVAAENAALREALRAEVIGSREGGA